MSSDAVRLSPSNAAARTRAAEALARAFVDYELMAYAVPALERRGRAVAALYGALLTDALRCGEAYTTRDGSGAACWLPPGREHLGVLRQLRAGMASLPLRFGPSGFGRLLAYDVLGQALHHELAPEPHWYLSTIGVEPAGRGRGAAAALLRPILERADAAGLPCYLETHREANVAIYRRHGFDLVRRAQPSGRPVAVFAMLRRPR